MNNTKSTNPKNVKPKNTSPKAANTPNSPKSKPAGKSKKPQVGINYTNKEKINKNFMYKDLKRSNCYECDFSNSNFDFTSFRGAHFKSCNFYGASFKAAEFVGSNLRKSRFKKARFEDAIFEGVNLDGVDFAGTSFKNTIFVDSDVSKVKNLNTINVNIKIYDKMPELDASEALVEAIKDAMTNKYVKASRVLDNKDGEVNALSVIRLRHYFEEEILIGGLAKVKELVDRDFCTLSYIIKIIADYEAAQLGE